MVRFYIIIAVSFGLLLPSPTRSASAEDTGEQLIRYLEVLKSGDPGQKVAAIAEIGRMGPAAAVMTPELLEMLWDDAQAVKLATLKTLGKIGADNPEAIRALTEFFWEKDPQLRLAAIDAVSKLGPKAVDAIDSLVTCLDDNDPIVRNRAAAALGQIGTQAGYAVADILRVLDEEHLDTVSALDAISRMGPESATAVSHLDALLHSRNKRHSQAAITALMRMGKHAVDILPTLLVNYSNKPSSGLVRLFGSLGNLAGPAVPLLVARLEALGINSSQKSAKTTIILAFKAIGTEAQEALEVLQQLAEIPVFTKIAQAAIAAIEL